MADLQRIEEALRAAHDAGDTAAATTLAQAYRDAQGATSAPPPMGGDVDSMMAGTQASNLGPHATRSLRDTLTDVAGRYGEGFEGGANLLGEKLTALGNRIAPTDSPVAAANTQSVGREADAYRGRRDALGVPGMLGEGTPEMFLSSGPITSASRSMLPLATRAIGAKAAPLAADLVANAAYEGGKGAVGGGGITDIVRDAGIGGAGAVAGRVGGNVLKRALSGTTPQSRELLARGVTPTYGQAFNNEGILATVERGIAGTPFAGPAVDAAKARAMRQYSEAEVDAALKASGIPHQGSGFQAVREVNEGIHRGYESVKPQTYLDPGDVKRAAGRAQQAVRDIPLLTEDQEGQVGRYYVQKVAPLIQRAEKANTVIDGVTARKLSVELGDLAHKHATSQDVTLHPLGQAFGELKVAMDDALKSNNPAVLQHLQMLNGAYRRMVPINLATERAASTRGQFTPNQFRSAATQSSVPGYDPRMALNDAARETLNEPGTGLTRSLSRNLGVPGLAGAGAVGAHAMGIPPEAIAATTAAVAAGGTAVAHALYSEPGIRMMLGAMNLIPRTAQWVAGLAPERQREFVHRMMAENPQYMQRLAAQVGRQLAGQQMEATP